MPVTVAAPLNTGGIAQTKTGALALTGNLTASSFIDFDNYNYYVNPSGQTLLAGPVGIGTTNPTVQLTVGVDDGLGGSATGSAARIAIAPPHHTGGDWIFTARDNTPTVGHAYLDIGYGSAGASQVTIDANGLVGIGTTNPTEILSLSPNGGGMNIRQGNYSYLGSDYSAWTTVLGQNVRARRGTNVGMEIGSSYLGSGASAVRMNWSNIEFHAASATDIASLPEGSAFNFPKMTIQSDGKIVINNGGQLCIGTACVASSTWATIVNNAGSGGGGGMASYSLDTSSNDDYAFNTVPSFSSYTDGQSIYFKANTLNTGNATVNVNSIGKINIKKGFNSTLADGNIQAGQIVQASISLASNFSEANITNGSNSNSHWLNNAISQPFLSDDRLTLTKARFALTRYVTSPSGTLYAKLYAGVAMPDSSPSGQVWRLIPTGAPLAVSDPVSASGVNSGWVDFNFSGVNQYITAAGEYYCIVLEHSGPNGFIFSVLNPTAGINYRYSTGYGGGAVSNNGGGSSWSSWSVLVPYQGGTGNVLFEVIGTRYSAQMLSQGSKGTSDCYTASAVSLGTALRWDCRPGDFVTSVTEGNQFGGQAIQTVTCCSP